MAGKENLIPGKHKLTLAEQSAAGKKSGAVRKQKADLRKAIQAALDAEYTDKNGKKFTGTEGIAQVLVVKALDKKDKDCVAAIKYLAELLGMNRSDEQKERDKAEIELLKAKIKACTGDTVTYENEMPELYKALGATTDDDIL